MRIISFSNNKGGVGKTTSAVNIGAGLQRRGLKVLLIDLDPQAHSTVHLGVNPDDLDRSVYNLLKGTHAVVDVTMDIKGLHLIPSHIDLSAAEMELVSEPARESLLKTSMDGAKYDYILIDCPPSLGILTLNALTYAKEIFVPLEAEYLSLRGLGKLIDAVEVVRGRLNKDLKVTGIIATKYDGRRVMSKEITEVIKQQFGDVLFKTMIRRNVALAEAPSHGMSIFEYQPSCHGAEDYTSLCEEING